MNINNNKRFMFRMVFSYSTVLVIILIMGVKLNNISIKNVRSEIREQNKLMLQNAVHKMDADLTTMDALAGQVASNSKIVSIANKKDNKDKDYYLLASVAKDDLSIFIHTENLLPIDNYFIYLQQSGYILSYSQFADCESYYFGKRKYIQDRYDDWLKMMNNSNYHRQFISLGTYKNNTNSSYLYMLPLKNFTLRDIPATICFEIDMKKLTSIYSNLNLFDTGYIYVTDKEGNQEFLLSGKDMGEVSTAILKELNYKKGLSQYDIEDEEMLVTHSTSNYNQWNYYLVQPAAATLYSLEHYRDVFIVIICLALVIGFILIFLLSKTNVKPIIRLDNELRTTITRQKSLQMIVDEQKPIIQQSYLSRIMHGGISSPKELDYASQYLNISTNNRKFSALYIIIYMNQYEFQLENSANMEPNTKNYDDIIKLAINDFFEEDVHLYKSDEREYALLLSSPSDEPIKQSSDKAKEAFHLLHEYLMGNYSIWTFAGLGNWHSDLMVTWKSYQQASEVINYATKDHIIRSYACVKRDTNVFYYPIELAGQLTNFIIIGNESQVIEIFNVIRHENIEELSQPVNMMKCLLSDIRNTLFKIRFTIHTDDKNLDKLKTIDAMFDEHMSLKLCEDISLNLCRLFDSKCSRSHLVSSIKKYIKENYNDPSLCLNKISDEFLISESYFSFLFKEETGENFSTYLERIRMEQAIQLIKETDLNICNLYKEIGYNNSNTFRRAFKKIYGVSPKTMREVVGISNVK